MNLKKTLAFLLAATALTVAQEAAPAPNQEAAPALEQKAAPAPKQESAPAPKPEAAPAPKQEAAPAPVQETAPAPKQEVASAPEQESTPASEQAAAPVRQGPPKTPFTVLHGNAYNRVENEAAGDNVNYLLNKRLTKMAFNKFFYIEPSGEMGAFSLGGFFGAMDISGELGRATAGYATPSFAVEARLGLGQIKRDVKGAEIKETVEGDDWGLTLSKTLGGYVVTLAGDWTTFAKETNVEPTKGPKTEQRYRDIDASLMVTDGPSASKHFWSAGVAFNRHEDELERGGSLIGDSLTSRVSIVPVFNYGTPALRASYANVYLGVNASVPTTIYDKLDMHDTTSEKKKEASLFTTMLNLSPNILGEVLLGESFMLFGEASYTWKAFRYLNKDAPGERVTLKESVADKVEASMGLRYQYKDWAACEFAFGDSFFTDTKSIFNGEGVFVSFGGFIYF